MSTNDVFNPGRAEAIDVQVGGAHDLGKFSGQAKAGRSRLCVDDDSVHGSSSNLGSDGTCRVKRVLAIAGVRSAAVGQQDEERCPTGIVAGCSGHFQGDGQSIGKGRGAANGQIDKAGAGNLATGRWLQDDFGPLAAHGDERNPVTTLVGIGKQTEYCTFRRLDAIGGTHRAGCVDDEDEQVAGLRLPTRLANVISVKQCGSSLGSAGGDGHRSGGNGQVGYNGADRFRSRDASPQADHG